jgi:hypothetical protein
MYFISLSCLNKVLHNMYVQLQSHKNEESGSYSAEVSHQTVEEASELALEVEVEISALALGVGVGVGVEVEVEVMQLVAVERTDYPLDAARWRHIGPQCSLGGCTGRTPTHQQCCPSWFH